MSVLVLQARHNSFRLSEKCLLPLGGRPLLFRVMQAFEQPYWTAKILACPENSVSFFADLAEEAGFLIIPGPEEDVLERYCNAIIKTSADRIVRATADNPFVFSDAAIAIDREGRAQNADYAAYTEMPYGAGVESVASEALLRAQKEASESSDREHVCPYLYKHPELFRILRLSAPPHWQGEDFRITVDTQEDYKRALILYEQLRSLPVPERNLGENIIAACRQIQEKKSPRISTDSHGLINKNSESVF